MNTAKELNNWYGSLPFEAKEKIHSREVTESNIDECVQEWENLEKESKFLEYYDTYINYTGEYEELLNQLENE